MFFLSFKKSLNCLNNSYVEKKVNEELEQLGIKMYEGFEMHEWNDGKWRSGQFINKIYFVKNKNAEGNESASLSINCCVNIL